MQKDKINPLPINPPAGRLKLIDIERKIIHVDFKNKHVAQQKNNRSASINPLLAGNAFSANGGEVMEIVTLVAMAKEKALSGVKYTSRYGATCPCCGERMKNVTVRPWVGQHRVRYHICTNLRCIIHSMRQHVKSIETDESVM